MKLTKAQRKVLIEARGNGRRRPAIGLHRSGNFRSMCERLMRAGLLEYVGEDTVRITPAGRAALTNKDRT